MENKINLEEFMLKQLDVTLNMKDRIETKITAFLPIVSLIMTAILAFISIGYAGNFMHLLRKHLVFVIIAFFLGLFEMVLCTIPLFAGKVWYFYIEDLMNVYRNRKNNNESSIEQDILEHNEIIINKNERNLDRFRKAYFVCSVGMLVFIISFIILAVVFFVSMLGGIR